MALCLAAAGDIQGDGFGNPIVPDNIFARIASGSAPAAVVYRDRDAVAFMDIAPLSPGHVLVVSRRSNARSLIDMPPAELAQMMAVARRVMIAQRDALGATGAAILISNGSYQSVPQLHVHVIPKYRDGGRLLLDARPTPLPMEQLEPVARKIAAAMPPR